MFVEKSVDELWPNAANILSLAGMENNVVDGNTYELTLSDVTGKDALQKAAERIPCKALSEADEKILKGMYAFIKKDDRPVPLPEVIDWSSYLPDISQIIVKNEKNAGLLLVSEVEDALVIELAYSTNNLILPAMLGHAYRVALEKYGEEKVVLVPVVVNKTAKITEHMAPNAKRDKLLQGISRV